MKLPGIFELTRREQRAVILIVIALVAAAAVKRYRNERAPVIAPKSIPAQASSTPFVNISEAEVADSKKESP
jgi:hypothetical protein